MALSTLNLNDLKVLKTLIEIFFGGGGTYSGHYEVDRYSFDEMCKG